MLLQGPFTVNVSVMVYAVANANAKIGADPKFMAFSDYIYTNANF